MAEENKDLTPTNQEEQALLKAYKELQAGTVSKEQYEKDIAELKEKNAIYLKAITEGSQVDTPSNDSSVKLTDAIANISNFKGTNLQYWQEMTPIIDRVLTEMPEEEITRITGPEGLDEIVKVNEAMKQMVKDANGDPDYFRTIYNKKVTDSSPKISSDIEKSGGLVNYFNEKQK
ncbi:MAG: hypothetical protein RR839_00555 [Oscillospiraceae bacterium]